MSVERGLAQKNLDWSRPIRAISTPEINGTHASITSAPYRGATPSLVAPHGFTRREYERGVGLRPRDACATRRRPPGPSSTPHLPPPPPPPARPRGAPARARAPRRRHRGRGLEALPRGRLPAAAQLRPRPRRVRLLPAHAGLRPGPHHRGDPRRSFAARPGSRRSSRSSSPSFGGRRRTRGMAEPCSACSSRWRPPPRRPRHW